MKISLVCMPYYTLDTPSIALTQLKSELERQFGENVEVNIYYFNHDFSRLIGKESYEYISDRSIQTGIGDWFFRQEAFIDEIDNSIAYFKRYGYNLSELVPRMDELIELRGYLGSFLEELILKNELNSSDVVGFTSLFSQNIPSLALARMLKEINPEISIVMGGSNCEYPMGLELIKNIEYIDYIFSGQALVAFPQFINNLMNFNVTDNDCIDGVFSRNNYKQYLSDKPMTDISIQKFGENCQLNKSPFLNYKSFFDSYREKVSDSEKPKITMETSKGCWWGEKIQCSFCGLNGNSLNHNAMDADYACDYINKHLNEYANFTDEIIFTDLVLPKKYIEDVIPKLNVPNNISMFYEVRPDINEAELMLLASKNINKIQPGIEAFSNTLLKLMNKGISGATNVKLLKNCVQHTVTPFWNLIIGFPDDTENVYKFYYDMLPSLYHLPPPNIVSLRYDRFSEYHNNQDKYNIDLKPYDYYNLIYPFNDNSISNLAYYFADCGDNIYIDNLLKWEDKLKGIVNKWGDLWSDIENKETPKLIYKTPNEVYDTRSGSILIHELNEVAITILGHLDKPQKKDQVINIIDTYPEFTIEDEWGKLKNKGLIFHEENHQAISLVLKQMN